MKQDAMELQQTKRIIEAALLASPHPLTLPQLSALFDEFDMPPHDELARAMAELREDCASRGIELVEVASGFRFQVRRDIHAAVSRLWTERPSRYSRALLETLALIAYRQPITRAEIEQIRGVAVSTSIVRTLEEREWVRVVGYRDLPGKPALFGTTRQFLDYFNLKSLDELPALGEIRDLEDLEPQLALDGSAPDGDTGLVPIDLNDGDIDLDEGDGDDDALPSTPPADATGTDAKAHEDAPADPASGGGPAAADAPAAEGDAASAASPDSHDSPDAADSAGVPRQDTPESAA
jgi:segregation and condensation protein B